LSAVSRLALVASERVKEEENGVSNKDEPEDEDRGLTFDETSEFVQAVGNEPIVKPKQEPSLMTVPVESELRDVSMAPGDVALDELEAGEVRIKDEDDDIDVEMLDEIEHAIKETEAEEKAAAEAGVGTSSEQHFASGMAAALNILRQQGILAQPNSDQLEREKVQVQRDLWLAEQRRRQAQRELGRLQARGANKDQAQREYENRLREQQEAREQMETFKNYKPDIDLSYHDEFGRKLSMKEAWKALSHKFHGKGSGKMKTEKRLKKIAEEKKKEAMASGDTPLSMNRAFQIRQEKTGQAHFVLSVGNRGYGLIHVTLSSFILTFLQGRSSSSRLPRSSTTCQGQDRENEKEEGKQDRSACGRIGVHDSACTFTSSDFQRDLDISKRFSRWLTRAKGWIFTYHIDCH
jgi:U4/U6.U5 tri-snRNP-associated protein 1